MNILAIGDSPSFSDNLSRLSAWNGCRVTHLSDRAPLLFLPLGQYFDAVVVDASLIAVGHSGVVEVLQSMAASLPVVLAAPAPDAVDPLTGEDGAGDFHVASTALAGLLGFLTALGLRPSVLQVTDDISWLGHIGIY